MTWFTAISIIFPQAKAYGRLIIPPKEALAGWEFRESLATLKHDHSPFLCIYKISAQQFAFE